VVWEQMLLWEQFTCFSLLHTGLPALQVQIYKEIQPKHGVELKHWLSNGSASTFQTHLYKMSKDWGTGALYWLQNPDVELYFAG